MNHFKENLLFHYSVASFVILAIIGLVLAVVLSEAIRVDAIEDLTAEAVGVTTRHLLSIIDAEDLKTPMTGFRYDKFHKFVQDNIVSDRTARIKVWSKDGTLIYSGDRASVGDKYPNKGNLLVALSGHVSTDLKILDEDEKERERFVGNLVEVYSPIVFEGFDEPLGAFEIYQYYQPIAQRIEALQRLVFISVALGLLIPYGSLVLIVWRGWTRIKRQQSALETTNEQLTQEISQRNQLHEQLLQSQKMEAIGTLAGGIAHDFNNMLSAIMGFTHLLKGRLNEDEDAARYLEEIQKASDRASLLTNHLLAFSRRQVVSTRVINVNQVIRNLDGMFRRLIREDIELVQSLEKSLWQTELDPNEMEQILVNLVINARDALPDGGKLQIETANETLSGDHPRLASGLQSGDFVKITISDTGIGMSEEIKTRVFEPFFTTKEAGKGTGLGLSTAYGIITQSDGFIEVDSQPGKGTEFKVYLPRTLAPIESGVGDEEDENLPTGNESILVVDDESTVRGATARVLREQGYEVFEAANGIEALELANQQSNIHLLLTDMVMPIMSGRMLAQHFNEQFPKIKILFMSGYTDDILIQNEVSGGQVPFLQKPLMPYALAGKVREVLDSPTMTIPA